MDTPTEDADRPEKARLDLHSHSSASFDSQISPQELVAAAVSAGLTHIAITDHDGIDGAVLARDSAPPGIVVIVGEEIRTTGGDIIALFLERAIPSGMSVADTSAAIREQGGLVGLPHPFDSRRPSVAVGLGREALDRLARLVDYVEVHNARVRDGMANSQAADFASRVGAPGVAVSDAHTLSEVGGVLTVMAGDPRSARELLRLLPLGARFKVTYGDTVTSTPGRLRRFLDGLSR